ncbi:MAG: hypothetical protein PUK70_09420 [Bacteroidales bacterium]|nr:hypothetical protein [Bacteroidales bacterium]MDY6002436.1 hypothetical protein [Candidatus Cryptobacteroides sp.]
MKKFTLIAISLIFVVAAYGQPRRGQSPVKFVYDVDFQYYLDNCEYAVSNDSYDISQTLNSARLTPLAGLRLDQSNSVSHYIHGGIDIMRNFGEHTASIDDNGLENSDLFREIVFWYAMDARFDWGRLQGRAGIFPKRYSVIGSRAAILKDEFSLSEAELPPTLFISRENRFYDNNMEGLLMNISTRKSYFEAGLDWIGKYGYGRRETFRAFTYGNVGLGESGFKIGWASAYLHYANSEKTDAVEDNVVDNTIFTPYVAYVDRIGNIDLGLKLSYVQGFNQDRFRDTGYNLSYGGMLTTDLSFNGIGILNDAYYGMSQMPYYDLSDVIGQPYAGNLYCGSPFYKINGSEKWNNSGFYDRLEAYWQKNFGRFLALRTGLVFHFSDNHYDGWQQQLTLIFNLERAINKQQKQRVERRYFEFSL